MTEDWADKGGAVLATRPDGAIVMQRAEMEIIVHSGPGLRFWGVGSGEGGGGRWRGRGGGEDEDEEEEEENGEGKEVGASGNEAWDS
ncbi:hypothetical protein HO133_010158 [Letharia lupina]|uniref:Uncharacterized protein n=1 Tax=Letharia lupina TaxID=560253 RepID=A0A8H6CK71_9LECA|nr:uncharacterized protein HO133_010158 [Letharia lupina]KAF6224963.1 hypothetical protein HO133_010158 [Letharia lupina]